MYNRKLLCDNVIIDSVKKHTTQQLKIFYFVLYKFKEENVFKCKDGEYNGELDVVFNEEELKEIFKNQGLSFVDMIELVQNIPYVINTVNSVTFSFKSFPIFETTEYHPETGEFYFRFNKTSVPMLIELEKNFSVVPIDKLFELKGKYSPRLFEMYCRYKNQGYYKLRLDFLRIFLNIPISYNISNMDRVIIKPALKELKQKLGVNITFSKEKRSGIVTHYIFKFN